MARKAITVKGDEAAEAVILRAGRKTNDQSRSLNEAAAAASIQKGAWKDDTGRLTASLTGKEIDADSLKSVSSEPYSRYVFYGTVHQPARPPHVNEDALIQAVTRQVANDLVGE